MSIRPRVSYTFSVDNVPNVAAANNYVALFNPADSGKSAFFEAVSIGSTLLTSSPVTASMRGYRISAVSGGTVQAAAAVTKHVNTHPNPAVQVRTGNPTVTLGPAFFNSPAPLENKASPLHMVQAPPGAVLFGFGPGEGIVLRTESGIGVGATWNFSITWSES